MCMTHTSHDSPTSQLSHRVAYMATFHCTFERLCRRKALCPLTIAPFLPLLSTGNFGLMHKRKSFEHEREVRAIAWEVLSAERGGDEIRRNATPTGLPISINLEALVEFVYVHPSAPPWFGEIVTELVRQQNLKFEVRQSLLGATPLW